MRLDDWLRLLVILVVEDGHRESEATWHELLTGLRERALLQGAEAGRR